MIAFLFAFALNARGADIILNHEDVIRLALEQIEKAKSSLFPALNLEYALARVKTTPNLTAYSDSWSHGE